MMRDDAALRTTLALDAEVMEMARAIAESRRISIGEAVSYLARRGAEAQVPLDLEDGFPVFRCEGRAFGPDDIRDAQDAEDAESAKYFLKGKAHAR